MKIKVLFKYWESIIPPRCRKARYVEFDGHTTVTIKEISSKDAPIAIIERATDSDYTDFSDNALFDEIRLYKNHLYTKESRWRNERIQIPDFRDYYHYGHSKSDKIKGFRNDASQYLIIDDIVYARIGEPRYVVMTFGLGCNHGGTSLSIDYHYNSNISKNAYFRIDQYDDAVAKATFVATRRGDDKYLPIEPQYKYEILIPEAIKLNPQKEHGDGDGFMNECEDIIESVKDPLISGLMLMAKVFK